MDMVRLTQLEEEYLPLMRDWRNTEEIRFRTREYALLNMVNQKDWFEKVSRDRNNEMFAITFNNILVGVCGLCYIDWVGRTAEVSIYVGLHTYRKKGIGTQVLKLLKEKAFNEFNLHRIWAEIYETNTISIALFEKAGYEFEGRLKEHAFQDGEYRDALMYGLVNNG